MRILNKLFKRLAGSTVVAVAVLAFVVQPATAAFTYNPFVVSANDIFPATNAYLAHTYGTRSSAIRSDGTLWLWGVGTQSGVKWLRPAEANAANIQNVKSITQNGYFLKTDGTVWKFTDLLTAPTQVAGLSNIIAISGYESYSGYQTGHTLALKMDGTVWAWGANAYGQLGNGTTTASLTPVQVTGLTGVTTIAAGSAHSLARKGDGTVWAWGVASGGALGIGSNLAGLETCVGSFCSVIPRQSLGLTSVTTITAGSGHSLVRKSDGTVWAFGKNNWGQTGQDNANIATMTPTQVAGLYGIVALAAGDSHSLALRSDGTVRAWGYDGSFQLGTAAVEHCYVGTQTHPCSFLPVQSELTGVNNISAGSQNSYAMKLDGSLWSWGEGSYGQLGTGTTFDSGVPTQITYTDQADLSLSAVASDSSPSAGQNVTYDIYLANSAATLNLSNDGQVAYGVQVRDLLPAGLTYVSHVATQGTYDQTTGLWNVGTVIPSTSPRLSITASVGAQFLGMDIVNAVEVVATSATDPDSTPGNGIASEDDYARIMVRPNTPPVAVSDAVTLAYGTGSSDVTASLMANDTDAEADVLRPAYVDGASEYNCPEYVAWDPMNDPYPPAPLGYSCLLNSVGIARYYNATQKITFTPSAIGTDVFNYVTSDGYENSGVATVTITVTEADIVPPTVAITSPIDESLTNSTLTDVTVSASDAGSGVSTVRVNGIVCEGSPADGIWTCASVPLSIEGDNILTATVTDIAGNIATDSIIIARDSIAPVVAISAPIDGLLTNQSSVAVAWTVDGIAQTTDLTA
ncbi:MAG: hypothetical protein WCT10_03170, partial [Patescibacteria group bacterium]